MNRIQKVCILILISMSVFFIYQKTKNTSYTITVIGDQTSLGINSYGIKDYSYIDYIQEDLKKTKEKIMINKDYISKDQNIKSILQTIKQTPNIKRTLSDTDLLILSLGTNDLVYALSLEDKKTPQKLKTITNNIHNQYKDLIQEIKKYYHNQIIIIGYYPLNTDDYYKNKGVKELNKQLKQINQITFIDTEYLLKDRQKYFLNPNSNYPNREAYQVIAQEIIKKTLEKKENI